MPSGDDDISKRFFAGEDAARKSSTGLPRPSPRPPSRVLRTMELIAQVGIDQTRSPSRIARFVGGGLLILLAALFGLSRLGVSIPLLSPGGASSGRVFTGANDDPALRTLRDGKPKPPPLVVPITTPHLQEHPQGPAARLDDQRPLAHKEEQQTEQLADTDKQQLAQLYASQDLTVSHKAEPEATTAPAVDRAAAALTAAQVAQTVAKFQSGYASCINQELKRNPGFPGGKVRIVTTIAGSGIVRHAEIQSELPELARSVTQGQLGPCLVNQTRRIVFPSFAGDPVYVEIPLVLGAAE